MFKWHALWFGPKDKWMANYGVNVENISKQIGFTIHLWLRNNVELKWGYYSYGCGIYELSFGKLLAITWHTSEGSK